VERKTFFLGMILPLPNFCERSFTIPQQLFLFHFHILDPDRKPSIRKSSQYSNAVNNM